MKNVSFKLVFLVALLSLVFRQDLVKGRTLVPNRGGGNYHDPVCNSDDPSCNKPCNPENPNCAMKQGDMDTNRADRNYQDPPCDPYYDPNCVKPCNPENPNC
ncbi:hypothetical protein BRARA_E03365 [Brassica rapa]|uniref:BnaA05g31760D protein n=2 Tax=Brassica TaxID=3705 RepID=A0A078GRH5_BRANA|nr:hypothetical protein BRARA_E03365 [Brassica rapa]CAG7878390.1 unnamed protein product [Brassica rapa]CDY27767.1 BnaA05g31760D [Brassica napus]VDC73319.1 unnamed protein product [Brassica rapa]